MVPNSKLRERALPLGRPNFRGLALTPTPTPTRRTRRRSVGSATRCAVAEV